MMRYGRGRARLARKWPGTITAPSLVPAAWLLWLAGGGLVGLLSAHVALAVLTSLAAYLLVLVGESVRVGRAEPGLSAWRLPTVFAAIHAGFGWGYLCEVAAGVRAWPSSVLQRVLVTHQSRARSEALRAE
jgi:hypothetical protein